MKKYINRLCLIVIATFLSFSCAMTRSWTDNRWMKSVMSRSGILKMTYWCTTIVCTTWHGMITMYPF